ncbi:hypothetical protein A3F66_04835 [candidate division TM6 bacterium RIFCSPHIGHO2_12_FULL_32_22]|nr:MAG: hypothetical protein A3F66_04835 [candidate division TM6 bacterium RIFCSPHIGHO2_12_FULL_32_22]
MKNKILLLLLAGISLNARTALDELADKKEKEVNAWLKDVLRKYKHDAHALKKCLDEHYDQIKANPRQYMEACKSADWNDGVIMAAMANNTPLELADILCASPRSSYSNDNLKNDVISGACPYNSEIDKKIEQAESYREAQVDKYSKALRLYLSCAKSYSADSIKCAQLKTDLDKKVCYKPGSIFGYYWGSNVGKVTIEEVEAALNKDRNN